MYRFHFVSLNSIILAGVRIENGHVFVGGNDLAEEGTFRWVNGDLVQGVPWYGNEPDNWSGIDHCMTYYFGVFTDDSCANVFNFMCQKT